MHYMSVVHTFLQTTEAVGVHATLAAPAMAATATI